MKVDYHFHPNIGGRTVIKKKLAAVWKAVEEHRIDAVICTEHVYKDAPRAYRELIAAKPAHVQTHVFPGAELLTSNGKGVDVIVFGLEDWYDKHPRLLKPFGMSLLEMIVYLESTDLFYYIPHPNLVQTPLKKLYKDQAMQTFLSSVPAVEAFNGCFLPLEHLCDSFPVRRMTRKLKKGLRSSANPSPDLPCDHSYKFLAVGSDAHHPKEIGFAVEVPCPDASSRTAAFESLTSNTDVTIVHVPPQRYALMRLLAVGCITMNESMLKKRILRKERPEAKILQKFRKMRVRSKHLLFGQTRSVATTAEEANLY